MDEKKKIIEELHNIKSQPPFPKISQANQNTSTDPILDGVYQLQKSLSSQIVKTSQLEEQLRGKEIEICELRVKNMELEARLKKIEEENKRFQDQNAEILENNHKKDSIIEKLTHFLEIPDIPSDKIPEKINNNIHRAKQQSVLKGSAPPAICSKAHENDHNSSEVKDSSPTSDLDEENAANSKLYNEKFNQSRTLVEKVLTKKSVDDLITNNNNLSHSAPQENEVKNDKLEIKVELHVNNHQKLSHTTGDEEKIEQFKWTRPKQRIDVLTKKFLDVKPSAQMRENGEFVGFMFKKKQGKRITGWKRRWFKLLSNSSELLYYKNQSETKLKGKIDVKLISLQKLKPEVGEKQWCFSIVVWDFNWLEGRNDQSDAQSEGRAYFFATDNESDLKDWIREINRAKKEIYSKTIEREPEYIGEELAKTFVSDFQQQLKQALAPKRDPNDLLLVAQYNTTPANNNNNLLHNEEDLSRDKSHLDKLKGKFQQFRAKSVEKRRTETELEITLTPVQSHNNNNNNNNNTILIQETKEEISEEKKKEILPNNLSPEEKRLWHFTKIIKEFITTEKDYHRDMEILATVFMTSLGFSDIASEEEIKSIFGNVISLMDVSKYYLDDLLELSELPTEQQNLGEITLKRVQDFDVFVVYCENQPNSLATIENLTRKDPQFATWLERVRERPECNRLSLGDYLIKPFQRLCKYPLLLKELLNYLPEDSIDRENLLKSKREFERLLMRANESKRNSDNLAVIREFKNRIIWPNGEIVPLMKEGRFLLKRGSFQKIILGEEKFKGDIFLFHDVIVILIPREKGKRFMCKMVISLASCLVWDIKKNNSFPFSVVSTETKLRMVIYCSTEQEKYNWMIDISDALAVAPPVDPLTAPTLLGSSQEMEENDHAIGE